ncbi:hypothetical protein SAMN05216429_101165 [Marinobacter persicus]|uniref:O-antigen ligase-related domain-containing protein n=1 Tax=Marinobacter persicus TaxID=930118 RepID=A0A1I3PEG1_9GAMM|nr:O-antigen ligase family protein [Marinobacter persicus]SFJ19801.1 hypothetical protein SAMN05216429_101165 [Marinobacter persicus]
MISMSFFRNPGRFLSGIAVELGLAFVLCSYYISGIVGTYLGSNVELLASAFPLIFGSLVILGFLASGRVLVDRGGKILMLFLFINFFIVFSAIKNFAPEESIFFSLRFFYAAIFLGGVAWVIASDKSFSLFHFYLYFCLVVSLLVVYLMLWGESHGSRLSVAGRNPIYFSLLCGLSFSASFICLISKVKFGFVVRSFLLISMIMSFLGLILSGGRGAVVSVIVTLLFYGICFSSSYIFSGKVKERVNLRFLISFLLMSVVGVFYFVESRAVGGVFSLFSGNPGASGSVRIELFNQWLRAFGESPFWGVGFSSGLAYPHNIIIELVFRFGVLGGIASMVLVYFVLSYTIIGFMSRILENRILAALILCSFTAGLFSFSIVMMSHLFIFIVFAAVFMGAYRFGFYSGYKTKGLTCFYR